MFFKAALSPWSLVLVLITGIDSIHAQNHVKITGVKTGINAQTGARPARREIRDLYSDLPAFSLYIQAMNELMTTPETTLTSYFQIAGIHGRPYIAYDGVNSADGSGIPIGYCTHGNTLFPTWHRPYLALIEQVMAGFAQTIAKTYASTTYQTAADNLRLPYWDWALINPSFPDIMTWPSIQIDTPTGLKNVTNPLFRYTFLSQPEPQEWFPTTDPGTDSFYGSLNWTARHMDANNITHDELITPALQEDGASLTAQVWNVFAQSKEYNDMSTSDPTVSTSIAFEGPHGTIHGFVGGLGQMSPVSFAGFDPAFWLHHCNVDRQFAMWQAIYPDSWITPSNSSSATWTISYNTNLDTDTPLTPFYTGDGNTFYTSTTARYTKAFGYSYPEIKDWIGTPDELKANVSASVNKLYNPDGKLGTWPARRMRIRGSSLSARDTARAWSVSLEVPNGALGEAFKVGVSVGDLSVGKLYINSAPNQAEVDAGVRRLTKSELTLSQALEGVDTDDVDLVVSLLKDKLTYSVTTLAGVSVPIDQVEGLKVVVQDVIITPATDITEFPTFGKKTTHPEVTE